MDFCPKQKFVIYQFMKLCPKELCIFEKLAQSFEQAMFFRNFCHLSLPKRKA